METQLDLNTIVNIYKETSDEQSHQLILHRALVQQLNDEIAQLTEENRQLKEAQEPHDTKNVDGVPMS